MNRNIFIFAGTTEGRLLFFKALECGFNVSVYVATVEGSEVLRGTDNINKYKGRYEICIGRLEKKQISCELDKKRPDIIFDATHPYAKLITQNIKNAAQEANIEYIRVLRESLSYKKEAVIEAKDTAEAGKIIKRDFSDVNILFTTGSKEAEDFGFSKHFYYRILNSDENKAKLKALGIEDDNIILGKGPFSKAENISTIKSKDAKLLVTKESGKEGGFEEKLNAARECGIDILVIKRPDEEGISLDEAFFILEERA